MSAWELSDDGQTVADGQAGEFQVGGEGSAEPGADRGQQKNEDSKADKKPFAGDAGGQKTGESQPQVIEQNESQPWPAELE